MSKTIFTIKERVNYLKEEITIDLNSDKIDVNAVPGGAELLQKVRDGEMEFSKEEVYKITVMFGLPEPKF
ncbi:hypothetical protein [Spirosoma flavum]|uniref:XRE family transcriptional regulator n=1 Tax=Spirosoma flavum TaxID=2048557 RepID=A0ABW6AM34_9BACT